MPVRPKCYEKSDFLASIWNLNLKFVVNIYLNLMIFFCTAVGYQCFLDVIFYMFRKYLARRRWQKCGQAIRAIERMTGLMKRSGLSNSNINRDVARFFSFRWTKIIKVKNLRRMFLVKLYLQTANYMFWIPIIVNGLRLFIYQGNPAYNY